MGSKLRRLINDKLISDNLPIMIRLANLACVLGSIAAVALVALRFFEGVSFGSLLIIIGGLVSAIVLYFTLAFLGKRHEALLAVCMVIINILLPIIIINSGGLHGGAIAFFALAITLLFLALKGKAAVILISTTILVFMITAVFCLLRPDLVNPIKNEALLCLDVILSVLVSGLIAGILGKYQVWDYERQQAKVQAANNAKSDFLANMSHDMLTPLNVIMGMAAVGERSNDPERMRKSFQAINHASEHLLGMINDLLLIDQSPAGDLQAPQAPDILKAVDNPVSQTSPKPAQPNTGTTMDLMESELNGITILLAEDMPINREIIISLLEPVGVVVDCASDGVKAVQMFRDDPERYHIILMDIRMPNMDGHEATRLIRALDIEHARSIPVIALSANSHDKDVEKSLECGMNAHLCKPVEYATLMRTLYDHLQKIAAA